MLDRGRPPQLIAGLAVFHDHADSARRYVLPDAPTLVASPEPQLSLVLFRGPQQGGFLQLVATLAPSEGQLKTVEKTLAETGRPPALARPDWRSGTVRIAGWLHGRELAPKELVVSPPSLVGDPLCVIAARLDAAGAALADAAVRGNALPTVVIFDLETLGLGGALGIEAEADLTALHDRLTAEGALTTPYGRARIAKTWEEAARDNVIRIRVVDESGDTEGKRAEAMRRIGDDLLARMFSPFPPAERPPQLSDGSVAPLELSFRLTIRREEVSNRARWDFRERRATLMRHYAAASLIDLLGGRDPSKHIHFADLTESSHEIVVRAEPELGRLGFSAIEVDIRAAGSTTVSRTLALTDAAPEARFTRDDEAVPLQFRVRSHVDPTRSGAADSESDWLDAPHAVIPISARRLFPPRIFTAIAGKVEFEWLDHVEVAVQAPEEPSRSLMLSSDVRSADAFFPSAGGRALSVVVHWRGLRDEPTLSDPPREVTDDVLILDSPFGDSINVLIVPLPLQDVATVVVELRAPLGDEMRTKTVSWDAPDRTPKYVGLRRLAGGPRRYGYRIQFIREDGTIDQKPWVESDATTLIVPSSVGLAVRTAEVILLGGGPADRGSFAIELALESGADRVTDLVEGERDAATLVLVLAAHGPPPVLTMREHMNSGEVLDTRWDNPAALTVVPAPAVVP
jgi:hypothetical protein